LSLLADSIRLMDMHLQEDSRGRHGTVLSPQSSAKTHSRMGTSTHLNKLIQKFEKLHSHGVMDSLEDQLKKYTHIQEEITGNRKRSGVRVLNSASTLANPSIAQAHCALLHRTLPTYVLTLHGSADYRAWPPLPNRQVCAPMIWRTVRSSMLTVLAQRQMYD